MWRYCDENVKGIVTNVGANKIVRIQREKKKDKQEDIDKIEITNVTHAYLHLTTAHTNDRYDRCMS